MQVAVLGLAGTLTLEGVPVSAGAGASELLASLAGVSAKPVGVEDFAAYSLDLNKFRLKSKGVNKPGFFQKPGFWLPAALVIPSN